MNPLAIAAQRLVDAVDVITSRSDLLPGARVRELRTACDEVRALLPNAPTLPEDLRAFLMLCRQTGGNAITHELRVRRDARTLLAKYCPPAPSVPTRSTAPEVRP